MKKLSTFFLLVACCIACSKDDNPEPSIKTMDIVLNGFAITIKDITAKKLKVGDVDFVEIFGKLGVNSDNIKLTIPFNEVAAGETLDISSDNGKVAVFADGYDWFSGAAYGTQPGSVIKVMQNNPGKKIKGTFDVVLQREGNNIDLISCKGNFDITF